MNCKIKGKTITGARGRSTMMVRGEDLSETTGVTLGKSEFLGKTVCSHEYSL
jgi:hypothetical protein